MKINYDSKRFLRVQQQDDLDRIEAEKANIVFWRNISLYFLSFAFALSLIFYWIRYRKKQKEVERMKLELEESKEQLLHFTKHFKDKGLIQTTAAQDVDNNLTLQILEESTILTKEEWETFKFHFEKVYPGFLKNLVKTYPDLTQGEIRFLSLKKLGLSNKEMAETLGVSVQSIRTTLHRLRKKVNLSSDEDIEVILGSLEPLT